jgi:hypothetical protein
MGKARNLSKLSSVLATDGAVPAEKGGTGTTTGASGGNTIQSITGFYPGINTSQTGTIKRYFANNITLVKMTALVSSTSTSNVVIGLKKNNINIANVTIAASAYSASTTLSASLIADTDYLTLDIVSGTGTDISVRLDYTSS